MLRTNESIQVEAGQLTIVLSSSWRLNFDAKAHLRKVFDYYHVPVWVSQTPSIGMYARAREILTWVSKYQPQAWVAVDDWALLMESRTLTGHFLQTNPKTGITPANVETVLRLFEAQVPSAILNELQPASTSTGVAARGRGPLHDGALSGIPEEAAPAVSAKAAAEHQDWLNMTLEEAIPGGGLYGRALATPEGGTVAGPAKPGEAGARKPARHSVRAASASNYPDRMKKIAAGMGLFAASHTMPALRPSRAPVICAEAPPLRPDLVEFGSVPATDFGTLIAPVYVSSAVQFETLTSISAAAVRPIKRGEILVVEHGYCEVLDCGTKTKGGGGLPDMMQSMSTAILGDPWLYNALQPRKEVKVSAHEPAEALWDARFLPLHNKDVLLRHVLDKIKHNMEPGKFSSVAVQGGSGADSGAAAAAATCEDFLQATAGGRLAVMLKLCRVPQHVTNADSANCAIAMTNLDLEDIGREMMPTATHDAHTAGKWLQLVRLGRNIAASLPGLASINIHFGTLIATEDIAQGGELRLCTRVDQEQFAISEKTLRDVVLLRVGGGSCEAHTSEAILRHIRAYVGLRKTAWFRVVLRNQFLARHGYRLMRCMHIGDQHDGGGILKNPGKNRSPKVSVRKTAYLPLLTGRLWNTLPSERYGDLCQQGRVIATASGKEPRSVAAGDALMKLSGEVERRASEDFGVPNFVQSLHVIRGEDELCATQTVEIDGLQSATELNGKLMVGPGAPLFPDAVKLRVQICDHAQKGFEAPNLFSQFGYIKGLPLKVLKRSRVVKSTRDAASMLGQLARHLTGDDPNFRKPADYDMVEDPVNGGDEYMRDRASTNADVAAELAEGSLYKDVRAVSPEDVSALFSLDEDRQRFSVRERFHAGEQEFVLFHGDLETDKGLQKSMLQLMVDEKFQAITAFMTLNHHIPQPRHFETMAKLPGDAEAAKAGLGAAATEERINGTHAPWPAAQALCIAEKSSGKVVGFLHYALEPGGIALDRPATLDEMRAALEQVDDTAKKAKPQSGSKNSVADHLYLPEDQIMQCPPNNGFWAPFGGTCAPKALDYVDNFHVHFQVVDGSHRGLGLGTKLLTQLQREVVEHKECVNRSAGTSSSAPAGARPAVLTTLVSAKHQSWYEKELGFSPPRRYGIVQHAFSSLFNFNMLWIPERVRAEFFDEPGQRRIMARPSRLPLARFDGVAFEEILINAMASGRNDYDTPPGSGSSLKSTTSILQGFSDSEREKVLYKIGRKMLRQEMGPEDTKNLMASMTIKAGQGGRKLPKYINLHMTMNLRAAVLARAALGTSFLLGGAAGLSLLKKAVTSTSGREATSKTSNPNRPFLLKESAATDDAMPDGEVIPFLKHALEGTELPGISLAETQEARVTHDRARKTVRLDYITSSGTKRSPEAAQGGLPDAGKQEANSGTAVEDGTSTSSFAEREPPPTPMTEPPPTTAPTVAAPAPLTAPAAAPGEQPQSSSGAAPNVQSNIAGQVTQFTLLNPIPVDC
eukprot:g7841.t1